MRLSTDPGDRGYHPAASACRVFLEGAQRWNVITADEEQRYALLHRLDEAGLRMFRKGVAVTEEFWGAVRIELPPGGLPPAGAADDCVEC